METNYKVYIHTCPNKKVYVGITRQEPEKRWLKGNGYFNTPYFYNAIKKYGWENIRHEVVCEGLTKQQAEEKEIELIALYRSSERDFGYNIEKGGKSIGRFSQETIEKIRKSATGRVVSQETRAKLSKALKGRIFSEETKKKISIAKKGSVASLETREKLSKINKGKKMPIEAVKKMAETKKGKKFSQETKNKMSQYAKNRSPEHLKKLSEALKGRKTPFETVIKKWKPIIQMDLNGKFIRKFGSATQAFQETGIDKRQINNCCKGRQKTAHGFTWKYDTNM